MRYIDLLRESWRAAARRVPHTVVAAVILPDHLHAVIETTTASVDYSRLWQEVKKGFSQRLASIQAIPAANARGDHGLWQARFWEQTIRDERHFVAHVDDVHINPLKHGLVTRVADWPHSSFTR